MKVYVLLESYCGEPYEIVGVYASLTSAHNAQDSAPNVDADLLRYSIRELPILP